MVKLGDKVKHMITGFEGIAIGITSYLSGCDQVGIRPQGLHEGKPVNVYWFDVTLVEVIEPDKVRPTKTMKEDPGGPQPTPSSSGD
jgi:hypothetical protein